MVRLDSLRRYRPVPERPRDLYRALVSSAAVGGLLVVPVLLRSPDRIDAFPLVVVLLLLGNIVWCGLRLRRYVSTAGVDQ